MDEAKRMADKALAEKLLENALHVNGKPLRFFEPWASGELLRHEDGGIYRHVGHACPTDDTGLRMLVDHVWPFEPTDIPWDLPVARWAGRFTRITEADLTRAMMENRTTAQQAVTNARTGRQAAAAAIAARVPELLSPADVPSDFHVVRAMQTAADLARTAATMASQEHVAEGQVPQGVGGLRFNPLEGGITVPAAAIERFVSGVTCVNRKGELMQLDPFKTIVESDAATGDLASKSAE